MTCDLGHMISYMQDTELTWLRPADVVMLTWGLCTESNVYVAKLGNTDIGVKETRLCAWTWGGT